jgi:hypothetical protein
MRRPRKTATTPSALIAIVDALPDDRLRPLLVQLLRAGADVDVLAAPVGDPPPARRPRRPYKRRTGSRPPGRKRGRPRKVMVADADQKRIARNQREAARQRAKRAAAKAAAEHHNGAGNGAPKPAAVTAKALWEHAARISPKTPWRAVARELGTNEAQALDAYRNGALIPGVTTDLIERFLELAPTA